MDCIWVNLENVGPPFSNLRYVSLYRYQNVIYTAEKSFSVVVWDEFANERLLVCQFDV